MTTSGRCIVHVDIDAFLAAVEQAHDPSLRGRPVIVGGRPDDRNLVMSCSYEARAKGIHPGMRLRQAAEVCRRERLDAVFLPGSSRRANRARARVVEVLRSYTPRVEVTSIDDMYMDLTGTERWHQWAGGEERRGGEPPAARIVSLCARIARHVFEHSGLAVSQGVGANRLVARIATRLAKPNGVAAILPGHEATVIGALPVSALPGIGQRIEAFLERVNVRTVAELRRVPRALLEATFGVHGLKLHDRCRAIDPTPVEATEKPPRSISRETTLEAPTADHDEVRAMLSYLVDRAAATARERRSGARTLLVKVHYVDQAAAPARHTWRVPITSTAVLQHKALELLERFLQRRVLIRLVGATLATLEPARVETPSLFGEREDRHAQLARTLDAIRGRHGFGRLLTGRSIGLLGKLENQAEGFTLRTPSLTQ